MKSRPITIALLIGVLSLSVSAVGPTSKLTPAQQQKALVKRINQGALRVFRTIVRQSARTISVDCELTELFEDLLLAADALTDSRHLRHNLVVVMYITSNIEQLLLATDISADMVMAWSHLHADIDRLAKMNGIKWTEAVITDQLIATFSGDVDTILTKVRDELVPLQPVPILATNSTALSVLLSSFRNSAQELNNSSGNDLHHRIETLRKHARVIDASLKKYVISSALQRNWRRVTSRLEELTRLYTLDSIELDHRSAQKDTVGTQTRQ